eukprot:TRINITY_DN5486_c0_g1_i1.p1 TRINITY_DN5486_c0_g1~~TRINITY_DN5486_c0_g1_i1.p1  ORF type:complete len:903 (-),score=143.12 TRINITY_DN5486_c0_g1_i1:96-2804(-)
MVRCLLFAVGSLAALSMDFVFAERVEVIALAEQEPTGPRPVVVGGARPIPMKRSTQPPGSASNEVDFARNLGVSGGLATQGQTRPTAPYAGSGIAVYPRQAATTPVPGAGGADSSEGKTASPHAGPRPVAMRGSSAMPPEIAFAKEAVQPAHTNSGPRPVPILSKDVSANLSEYARDLAAEGQGRSTNLSATYAVRPVAPVGQNGSAQGNITNLSATYAVRPVAPVGQNGYAQAVAPLATVPSQDRGDGVQSGVISNGNRTRRMLQMQKVVTDLSANDLVSQPGSGWDNLSREEPMVIGDTDIIYKDGDTTSKDAEGRLWLEFGGSDYLRAILALSWSEAEVACKTLKADLVSIHSEIENDFIYFHFPGENWIGLTDRAHANRYEWSDMSTIDFVKWAPGQPDDGSTHCMHNGVAGTPAWGDASCASKKQYVCKRAHQDVPSKTKATPSGCSGWFPPDGSTQIGSYCDYWGWHTKWCYTESSWSGSGSEFKKESKTHLGKFFVPCSDPPGVKPDSLPQENTGQKNEAGQILPICSDSTGVLEIWNKTCPELADECTSAGSMTAPEVQEVCPLTCKLCTRPTPSPTPSPTPMPTDSPTALPTPMPTEPRIVAPQDPMVREKFGTENLTYVVGALGQDMCPPGSARVMDEGECSGFATASFQKKYDGMGCTDMKTVGCTFNTAVLHFNTCEAAHTASNHMPVCRMVSGTTPKPPRQMRKSEELPQELPSLPPPIVSQNPPETPDELALEAEQGPSGVALTRKVQAQPPLPFAAKVEPAKATAPAPAPQASLPGGLDVVLAENAGSSKSSQTQKLMEVTLVKSHQHEQATVGADVIYSTWLATGCPSLPADTWLGWQWYMKQQPEVVWYDMYRWCTVHDKAHRMKCCSGSPCEPQCIQQNSWSQA